VNRSVDFEKQPVRFIGSRSQPERETMNPKTGGPMGIFARLSDIITSNINALLDRAENPEWMIAQIIREMEQGLASAKGYAATAIAAERRIGRELEQNRLQAEHWKAKAREALAADREDLARRALARKMEHEDLVQSLERQHLESLQTCQTVRTALHALEARLAEAHRKQRTLLARHRAALARVELHRFAGAGFPAFSGSQAKFDRLENQIIDFEDELIALADLHNIQTGLEADFVELERQNAIEAELQEMKREKSG
jgi:phage shock protein A